jgi:hypothetical protein
LASSVATDDVDFFSNSIETAFSTIHNASLTPARRPTLDFDRFISSILDYPSPDSTPTRSNTQVSASRLASPRSTPLRSTNQVIASIQASQVDATQPQVNASQPQVAKRKGRPPGSKNKPKN